MINKTQKLKITIFKIFNIDFILKFVYKLKLLKKKIIYDFFTIFFTNVQYFNKEINQKFL